MVEGHVFHEEEGAGSQEVAPVANRITDIGDGITIMAGDSML